MKVLAIDVGGTHVKILATDQEAPRKVVSGPKMTARQMVTAVKKLAAGLELRCCFDRGIRYNRLAPGPTPNDVSIS
jgi:hypothetical protein